VTEYVHTMVLGRMMLCEVVKPKPPRELPILMSGPMVRAILARRKRMTRRLAWAPCKVCGGKGGTCKGPHKPSIWTKARVGDTMWVREMFGYVGSCDPGFLLFGATWQEDAKRYGCENIPDKRPPMKPGIHMPRSICRLTLPLLAVRTEPLHAITDEDAMAEGIMRDDDGLFHWLPKEPSPYVALAYKTPRAAFQGLWESLHGRESWASNPKVVALSFDPLVN